MAVSISTEPRSALIVVCLSGITSWEQINETMQEVHLLREQTGFCQVLVNASERKESLGLMELYEVGQELSNPAYTGVRVAIFSTNHQPGLEFTRTITERENFGADVRVFIDEQSARAWLLSPQMDDETRAA